MKTSINILASQAYISTDNVPIYLTESILNYSKIQIFTSLGGSCMCTRSPVGSTSSNDYLYPRFFAFYGSGQSMYLIFHQCDILCSGGTTLYAKNNFQVNSTNIYNFETGVTLGRYAPGFYITGIWASY